MFGLFTHPKPVGSRRPIAELSVAGKQQLIVDPGHVLTAEPLKIHPPANPPLTQNPARTPRLHFSVSYSLAEYRSFVQEHMAVVMAKRVAAKGKRSQGQSRLLRWLIGAVAGPAFLLKKRRMPVCEFTIDEHEILRKAADGHLVVPWSKVVAVHRYSQGYLVERDNGGIPIPYRCLSNEQLGVLNQLIDRRTGGSTSET